MNELILTSKKQLKNGDSWKFAAEKYLWENVTKKILELYYRILKIRGNIMEELPSLIWFHNDMSPQIKKEKFLPQFQHIKKNGISPL